MQEMIRRIDHVSIAVRDLESAKRFFCDTLGGREVYSATEAADGFRWTAIALGSSCALELIDPVGEDSFLHRFLDRRGDAAHHITMQVHDLAAARAAIESRGVPIFGYNDADPAWTYFYVHPKHAFGVLLQFAEFDPAAWAQALPDPAPESSRTGPIQAGWVDRGQGPAVELSDGAARLHVAPGDLPELIAALRRLQGGG